MSLPRVLHTLRFITTYICNFDCRFCHREGILESTSDELPPWAFEILLTEMMKQGLQKLKFVGGEPLICRHLEEYVDLAARAGVEHIGITTNGSAEGRLLRLAKAYQNLNFAISIPSLDREKFEEVTRAAQFDRVLSNLRRLSEQTSRITINKVVDDPAEVGGEILVAAEGFLEYAGRIKLIAPCESPYNQLTAEQRQIYPGLLELMRKAGKVAVTNLHHTCFDFGSNREVVITTPYCPTRCEVFQAEAPTVRLTPRGLLKACMISGDCDAQLRLQNENVLRQDTRALVPEVLQAASACRSRSISPPIRGEADAAAPREC